MCAREIRPSTFCPMTEMDRRRFLALAGMSGVALKFGAGNPESLVLANEQIPTEAPRIRVLFVGPKEQEYWMSWPGAAFDHETFQVECSKTLASGASELDVQLEINPVPIHEPESIERELKYIAESPPDGLILGCDAHRFVAAQSAAWRKNAPNCQRSCSARWELLCSVATRR